MIPQGSRPFKIQEAPCGVLYAVLGDGKRGSYILFLETSEADFRANRRLYNDWYRSLTLY